MLIGSQCFSPQLSANSSIVACRTANPISFSRSVVGFASLLSATTIFFWRLVFPGMCMQYPGLQGGGVLGDASTPGTPGGFIAASAHRGTYSDVAVAGVAWSGEGDAATATAAAAARRRRATTTGGAVTPPRICARRAGRPTRRTGGRVRPNAAQRGASNRAARWCQTPPTSR